MTIAGRDVTLVRVFERQGPNFLALTAELEYKNAASGKFIARLMPEKRVYTAERQTTAEAAIRPGLSGDDYAVLGDGDDRIGYSLRLYYKPLISWIWGGCVLMATGGFIAMSGRRRPQSVAQSLGPSGRARRPPRGGAPARGAAARRRGRATAAPFGTTARWRS